MKMPAAGRGTAENRACSIKRPAAGRGAAEVSANTSMSVPGTAHVGVNSRCAGAKVIAATTTALKKKTLHSSAAESFKCRTCGTALFRELRCPRTKFCYCDKGCQLVHWEAGHRLECKALQAKHTLSVAAATPPAERAYAPAEFLCPISQDVMEDPVVAADNQTYERKEIQEWIDRSAQQLAEMCDSLMICDTTSRVAYERNLAIGIKSPLTGTPLVHLVLSPNLSLREQIKVYRGLRLGAFESGSRHGDYLSFPEDPVSKLLAKHGLGQYVKAFHEEMFDLDSFGELRSRDLAGMGIAPQDHAALLEAAAAVRSGS